MHKAIFVDCSQKLLTIRKVSKLYIYIVPGYLVRYQPPGSGSMALLLPIAMGNSREARKRVTSLIRGMFEISD